MSALDEMPAPLLAALNADLAVPGRWLVIAAHASLETTSVPGAMPGDPPTETSNRRVVATLQCAARTLTLVAQLTGPAEGASTELTINYMGTPFRTADAALIARIDATVAPLIALRAAELTAKLTAAIGGTA